MKHALFLVLGVALAVGSAAASCGGGYAGPPKYVAPPPEGTSHELFDPTPGNPTNYFVYVESVNVPEPVYAGEEFTIEFEVSAEFRQQVLWGYQYAVREGKWADDPSARGLDDFFLNMDIMDEHDVLHSQVLITDCKLVNPVAKGPPVTTLQFRVPGLAAGIYELLYSTVDESQLGGIGYKGYENNVVGDPECWDHVLTIFREFEVLPAEGAM